MRRGSIIAHRMPGARRFAQDHSVRSRNGAPGDHNVTDLTISATEPRFWRDDALPFIEARSVEDGRKVCYAKHSHETFSIGVVSNGNCNYLNRRKTERIGAGTVVVMNPGDVHACNPVGDDQWCYRMLYIDVPWLSAIQEHLGVS